LLKEKTVYVLSLFTIGLGTLSAQDVTTVNAASVEISKNLDLEAVASLFGDAKDLEEFEYKLNDPEAQISNLDLNEDGQVDYLRVVEIAEEDTHLIALQSVLGEDIYQDVATIEVEKDDQGIPRVQVVGDVYLYGPGYIIVPDYVHRPVMFSVFWRPFYRPYRSVFYWGYYPGHFHYWKPLPPHAYKKQIHVQINVRHTYRRTHLRYSTRAVHLHTKIRRNDFGEKYPDRSYAARRVYETNGTHIPIAGANQADKEKYRTAGVRKAEGTTKRVAVAGKTDGTKKRVATVKNPDGSRKTVAVKSNPDGSKRAVSVNRTSDGTRTVKKAAKSSSSKRKAKANSRESKRKPIRKKKKA
ncbi:MAG TPA: hypothetical protein VKN36_04005, partial [Eudoraea sp.]|nr:hypothetical protein [Eudoraea sp.]